MKPIQSDDPLAKSDELVSGNIEHLKQLFPEAWKEGKLDFDVLRQLLGGSIDESDEKYGLNWHGKRRARQVALTPSAGTLRPCPEDSVDWDKTKNLMIEGDNLEVLKLLQKSYAGKVKLIYIDPPYNTGRDFVYPDNFQDSIKNYLELTGQAGEGGAKLTTNVEASGRFHTDWLNMIYPRLKLARNLLRDDGVIFVSIDDNEIDNMLKVCAEIFGEENFCGCFIWEKKKKPSFLSANMGSVTEYIVCYSKNRLSSPPFAAGVVEDGKKYPFNNAGNAIQTLTFPPQSVRFMMDDQTIQPQDMSEGNIKTELLDDVIIRSGRNSNEFRLRGEWRYSQAKLVEMISASAEIIISKVPFRPNYINRSGDLKKTTNLLSHRTNQVPTNEDATEEIRQLFGADVMSHPKPSGLLKYLVRTVTAEGDMVLDFFAGSGTTAHGVWLENAEDGKTRNFVLVQIPEPLDALGLESKPGWEYCAQKKISPTISAICQQRLKLSGAKIRQENPLFAGDMGFRVFKLDSTNICEWDPDKANIAESLEAHVEHIKADRSEQDILFELLLKLGLDLCVPIETKKIQGKEVHSIGAGALIACLAPEINSDQVELLAQGVVAWHKGQNTAGDSMIVFRDSAFADDVAKTNLTSILNQNGLHNVRSL
jgi:adenine-specific DNA-methyltransferase